MAATLKDKTAGLRRRHIQEAAVAVFAERGFERATIKDIARAAGVSDGTIYNVFDNKLALLESLLDPLADVALAGADSPAAPLGELLRRRWDALTPQTLQMLRTVLSEALVNDDLRRRFFARVLEPVLPPPNPAADGAPVDDMTQRLLVGALIGGVLLRLLGDASVAARWNDVPQLLAALFAEPHDQ